MLLLATVILFSFSFPNYSRHRRRIDDRRIPSSWEGEKKEKKEKEFFVELLR